MAIDINIIEFGGWAENLPRTANATVQLQADFAQGYQLQTVVRFSLPDVIGEQGAFTALADKISELGASVKEAAEKLRRDRIHP